MTMIMETLHCLMNLKLITKLINQFDYDRNISRIIRCNDNIFYVVFCQVLPNKKSKS